MVFNNLIYSVEENICLLVINRPDKLNALNIETISEISLAISTAEKDENVRGIIITGQGSKAFVAGADIAEFSKFSATEARTMAENGHKTFNQVENCSKPVIAAVNGFALGGGCELAMACHIRIASANARFGQPEVNLGIIPGYGGTQRLVRLAGKGKATQWLLTGDAFTAQEAQSSGIVNEVVEQDMLIDRAKEILKKIARKSPLVTAQVLKLVNAFEDKTINGFDEEITEFSSCFNTSDFREGVSAFLEKRPADFTGK